jgi:para-nitrobenzyl esterase
MAITEAKTKFGVVRGISNEDNTVFRGIPYAEPPIGKLRFCAPVDPVAWTGERDCLEWTSPSVQQHHEWPPSQNAPVYWEGSEDCLYLNIWTPAKSPDEKLAVVFWIHGGGFFTGRANDPWLDGTAWNKRGVILVSMGYRMNAFGFLGLEELAKRDEHGSTGNYGIMDIFKALKWVNENIAAFGGDPENVTIAGQSSGAMATRWLLGCKPARGLFRHAIAQSGGGTWDIDPVLPFEQKCAYSQKVLDILGWTLDDVLTKEAYEVSSLLDSAVPQLGLPQKSLRARLFQPSVDNWLITDYYGKLIFEGASADVDIMVGSIRDEWQNYNCQVPNRIDGWEYEFAISHSIAWARRNEILGRKPVYTYFFDHDIPDGNGVPQKPTHNSEMPYTFGTFESFPNKWTDFDRRISETAVDYWTSFAKTGDPNTPGCALWLPYTATHPVTMYFTNNGWSAVNLDGREKLDKVVKYLLEKPGILDRPFIK